MGIIILFIINVKLGSALSRASQLRFHQAPAQQNALDELETASVPRPLLSAFEALRASYCRLYDWVNHSVCFLTLQAPRASVA